MINRDELINILQDLVIEHDRQTEAFHKATVKLGGMPGWDCSYIEKTADIILKEQK